MSETFSPFSFFYSGVESMRDNWVVVFDVHSPNNGVSGAGNPAIDNNSTIIFQASTKENDVVIWCKICQITWKMRQNCPE
jgi:hypothetical protein